MAELSSDPLTRYNQFRTDPWIFLEHCVYTKDEVDLDNPIKPFPVHLKYLYLLTQMWLKNKRLAIPKSRRMTASWTFIALALWDCIFHKGRYWAFLSKKELDSLELVERAEFIFKNIPETMISKDLLPKLKRGEMQSSPPVLDFEDISSKITGFPSGSNQLRQRGFSGILQDECAFWEDAESCYASSEPTIKGGGRMIMISSRAVEDGGFFKKIVFDQLDSTDSRFPEIPPAKMSVPMEGVEVWRNPKNEFTIVDLHYTANPAKRGEAFRDALKKTLPIRKFRQEYEKNWETYEGRPVYEDFNENYHLLHVSPKVSPTLPLILGWDSSGLTPACLVAQMQEDKLIIIREIMGTDIALSVGARRFVPYVAQQIKLHLPQITDLEKQTISFFDPAGLKRNEITEETYLHELIKNGFKQIRPGPMTFKKRVDGVVEYLIGLSRGVPKMQIYEKDCPLLVAGFKGGYRYSDTQSAVENDKAQAVKDIHSHIQDALQYICGGLKSYISTNYDVNIPAPKYGFQKNTHDITPQPRKLYGNDR